jgi:hypothetical protein
MNFKFTAKTTQPTVSVDAAATWQNYIVEDLNDEVAVAISGGRRRTQTYISWENQPALSWEETLQIYYSTPGAFIG